ncbi:MAG: hypothetical protein AMXMBFR53_21060 [Gemmatimonadota bacterium]
MKQLDGEHRESLSDLTPRDREALVGSILERAGPILAARRAARGGVFVVMDRWRRPIVSVSAGLIAAGLAIVLLTDDRPSVQVPVAQEAVFPEALVPRPIAAWLGRGEDPDVLELMTAIGGYRQ